MLPVGLVGVRHDYPGEGNSANMLRTDIVALLRRGQQRVEHLDRRLEHFDEFKKTLVRKIESARIAIGVRVVLREIFQLADIEIAAQRRRSEEHTSELQSIMHTSYSVFCLTKKKNKQFKLSTYEKTPQTNHI